MTQIPNLFPPFSKGGKGGYFVNCYLVLVIFHFTVFNMR